MAEFIGLIFLFLTLQNIFMVIEFPWYLGQFISDAEGGRTRVVKNGLMTYDFLKGAVNYVVFYIFSLATLYYLILIKHGSVWEGFLLGATVCASVATAIHAFFSRTNNRHIPVMLFDTMMTGGFVFAFTVYMWNRFYSSLSAYCILYILAFIFTTVLLIKSVFVIETTPYVPQKKSQ